MAAARKSTPPTAELSKRTAEDKEEDADTYRERSDSSSLSDADAESDGIHVEPVETFGAKNSGEDGEEEEDFEKPTKGLSKRAQTIQS